MTRNAYTVAVLLASGAFFAAPLSAQSQKLSIEARVGTTLPTGEMSDMGAQSGLLAEGELLYTPSLNFSIFGGVGLHTFNCKDEGCEEFSTRGLHGGVKYLFGQSGTATPWVRGALMLHEAELGESETGMGLGWSAGGGIDLALSRRFTLTPSLRYHSYNADFDEGTVDMSWLSLALGAHFHF